MSGEQHYHRRRRQRQRKQAKQAAAAIAATTATTNAETSSMNGSSKGVTTACVRTNIPPSNHRISNSCHQPGTHHTQHPNKTSTTAGRTSHPKQNMIDVSESDPAKSTIVVQCPNQKLYFTRSPTELTSGTKCFCMTWKRYLIPCTIVSRIESRQTYVMKFKYDIILDTNEGIERDVNHSNLWIISKDVKHPSPTRTVRNQSIKRSCPKQAEVTRSHMNTDNRQLNFRCPELR